MNKVTMTLAPLSVAVAESGKPLQTITLTLMGYVVQGQKGDPGDPGSALYVGDDPVSVTGMPGDVYIDTSTGDVLSWV